MVKNIDQTICRMVRETYQTTNPRKGLRKEIAKVIVVGTTVHKAIRIIRPFVIDVQMMLLSTEMVDSEILKENLDTELMKGIFTYLLITGPTELVVPGRTELVVPGPTGLVVPGPTELAELAY